MNDDFLIWNIVNSKALFDAFLKARTEACIASILQSSLLRALHVRSRELSSDAHLELENISHEVIQQLAVPLSGFLEVDTMTERM